jgi:hypothetical protein
MTGRVWTYVRDDRPFAGPAPPAAMFRYSRDHTTKAHRTRGLGRMDTPRRSADQHHVPQGSRWRALT